MIQVVLSALFGIATLAIGLSRIRSQKREYEDFRLKEAAWVEATDAWQRKNNEQEKHTMRYLPGYEEDAKNLVIDADEHSNGGASHDYFVRCNGSPALHTQIAFTISFQNGPRNEHGVNGITEEALIDILLDRLNAFQAGEYKCRENALVITKLEEAKHWLQHRTANRTARGVEGTMEK